MRLSFYLIFSILILSFVSVAFAQMPSVDDFYSPNNQFTLDNVYSQLDIEMTPKNPSAGQSVTLRLFGYANDLDRAMITYKVNGEVKLSEMGKKIFTFNVGGADESTIVSINVVLPTGFSYSKNLVIRPINMIIAWEADTYTPPFYEGKAMYSDQAKLKLVAETYGNTATGSIVPLDTIYTWKKDNRTIQDQSGLGANVATIDNDKSILSLISIELLAESFDRSVKTSKKISIDTSKLELEYYTLDQAMGIASHPIKTGDIISKDTTSIVAVPYFMAYSSLDNPLVEYEWYINSKKVNNTVPVIGIEHPGKDGYAQVEAVIKSKDRLFQRAQKIIRLVFEGDE